MRIIDSLMEKLLKQHGLTDSQIAELHTQATASKKTLHEIVLKNKLISEVDLTKLYAKEIEVPFAEFDPKAIKKEVLNLLPERLARQYRAVVFAADKSMVSVAMENPDDVQARNFLQQQLGNNIHIHIVPPSVLQAALDQYRGENITSELTKVIPVEKEEEKQEEVDEGAIAEDSPIAQTVNLIIEYAIKSGASDIHIEPREDVIVTRYRIDGILREVDRLPRNVLGALISRIKILSNLKIDEHRAPQDGRFKVQVNDSVYALRVSTLPVVDGEKCVMRILNESSKAANFDELGFWGEAKERLKHAIVQPHGMVLVTGPTGSGKSTTLFSVLSMLNSPTVNISTIEDPVEYRIPGVNQTQVNPIAGMTFQNGLRALLRQDPNIIMVGEIRDGETAELAVQAALTGHLVFSTLHTNNAATCLPRLLDMQIEPFLIASTVRLVVGQRLVRRLCTECREYFTPDEAQLEQLGKTFKLEGRDTLHRLHELEMEALKSGVGKTQATGDQPNEADLSSTPSGIHRLWRPHEGGCNACNHTGYRGRIGIYEVLQNSSAVQKLIMSNGTSEQMQDVAIQEGMVTMQIDGFIKALRGETSIEEVLRVTSEG
ncbi:type II/IV secretion system protein [Candidatus Saccharibacteria bacterium]|nr:type II/IV secretion system protein [Candidatus Saccharibacteria bacterium]